MMIKKKKKKEKYTTEARAEAKGKNVKSQDSSPFFPIQRSIKYTTFDCNVYIS